MSDLKRRNIDVDWLGKPIDCPDREHHTEEPPLSYAGWYGWAEEMAQTHRQVRCAGCKRYRIWEPIGDTE